jgi:hypothetical protein
MHNTCSILRPLIPEGWEPSGISGLKMEPDFDGKSAYSDACACPIIARVLHPEQGRRAALAAFDAPVTSAADPLSADAPAVRASATTISDRSSAGLATGVDCVEEMAVAPGNKGELSGKGDYFTAGAGRTWVRVPVVDAIVAEAYNSVDVAHSKDTGNVAARDDAVKTLRVHKAS